LTNCLCLLLVNNPYYSSLDFSYAFPMLKFETMSLERKHSWRVFKKWKQLS